MSTARDEEIARALQMEEQQRSSQGAVSSKQPPARSVPNPMRTSFAATATVVTLPDDEGEAASQQPRTYTTGVELAPPPVASVVAHAGGYSSASEESGSALVLAKMVFMVKSLAVASLLWWTFSVIFRAWWFCLSVGPVTCPVGWWGAHRRRPRLVLFFFVYLVLDLALQVLFPFVYAFPLPSLAVIIILFICILQTAGSFFTYRFWQMLKAPNSAAILTLDPLL